MKITIGILAGLGLLFVLAITLWVGGRLTNTFQLYVVVTPGNLPTLPVGKRFLASRFVTPERLDFIAFRPNYPGSNGTEGPWFHRVCGLPGDTVELRRGRLLVNGQNLDAQLNVAQHYAMATHTYYRLRQAGKVADTLFAKVQPDSTFDVALSAEQARRHPEVQLTLLPPQLADPQIAAQYHQPWNQDNFGPYRVPPGHYFLLGDNRLNALDSRYTGCIPAANFVATVFWY
jgi:signal peptidase I